jgi:hypothetical protein
MRAWWQPTAASYLGRVTKARILEAVTEAVSKNAADNLATLKKDALIIRAEEKLAGTGWLPPIPATGATDRSAHRSRIGGRGGGNRAGDRPSRLTTATGVAPSGGAGDAAHYLLLSLFMPLPRFIEIDGRRHLWRDLVALRRAQATPPAQLPVLFDLLDDYRPPSERRAAGRYREPNLFTVLDQQD